MLSRLQRESTFIFNREETILKHLHLNAIFIVDHSASITASKYVHVYALWTYRMSRKTRCTRKLRRRKTSYKNVTVENSDSLRVQQDLLFHVTFHNFGACVSARELASAEDVLKSIHVFTLFSGKNFKDILCH